MKIRTFETRDINAIVDLFIGVFSDADGTEEGRMVGQLARDLLTETDAADLHGFVAIDNTQLVGAVLFSRLSLDANVSAFILSPMAIATDFQRKGIGSSLINHGLEQLKESGVNFVTTYGDPAYYSRLGFEPLSAQTIEPPFELSQPIGWLGQSLTGDSIEPLSGRCRCVKALSNPAYW